MSNSIHAGCLAAPSGPSHSGSGAGSSSSTNPQSCFSAAQPSGSTRLSCSPASVLPVPAGYDPSTCCRSTSAWAYTRLCPVSATVLPAGMNQPRETSRWVVRGVFGSHFVEGFMVQFFRSISDLGSVGFIFCLFF